MSSLKNRLNKLEQKHGIDFDTSRPLNEWSKAELIAYRKTLSPEYKPLDLAGLSLDELRTLRDEVKGDVAPMEPKK